MLYWKDSIVLLHIAVDHKTRFLNRLKSLLGLSHLSFEQDSVFVTRLVYLSGTATYAMSTCICYVIFHCFYCIILQYIISCSVLVGCISMSCYVIHVLMLCAYVMHAVCSRLHVRLRLRLCYVVLCLVELCYVMYLISCYVMLSYLMLFKCYHCFTTLSCADMPAASSIRNIHTHRKTTTRTQVHAQKYTHSYTQTHLSYTRTLHERKQTRMYPSVERDMRIERERQRKNGAVDFPVCRGSTRAQMSTRLELALDSAQLLSE